MSRVELGERVTFEVVDGIGRLILCRPDRRNAVDLQAALELREALVRCGEADGMRALLIRSSGEHFTVGGDLPFLAAEPDRLAEVVGELLPAVQEAIALVGELDVPVVCAARGAAAGVGLGLLWGADVALVGDDLRLATGFAAAGLSGDGGSSWHLPRLAGLRRAQELLVLNRRIGAQEAVDWGLVSRAVPAAELEDAALEAAAGLAAGPTVALGRMRALLRAGSPTLREQLAAESDAILRCLGTEDLPAALAAFAEKRRPVFVGR